MPYKYVWPEEAFEVRIQCTEEQIQQHCDAAPENDRRDFDDRGGLQIPVYHVYKNDNIYDRLTFWYTLDKTECDTHEFDIRDLPNYPGHDPNRPYYGMSVDDHAEILQSALDSGMVRFDQDKLITTKQKAI